MPRLWSVCCTGAEQLPPDEACRESNQKGNWPARAEPYACAVVAQAHGRHKDALKLGWQLE
eukprot:3462772-Prymnesium_polylepis.1